MIRDAARTLGAIVIAAAIGVWLIRRKRPGYVGRRPRTGPLH
jgi:hypothetical protein